MSLPSFSTVLAAPLTEVGTYGKSAIFIPEVWLNKNHEAGFVELRCWRADGTSFTAFISPERWLDSDKETASWWQAFLVSAGFREQLPEFSMNRDVRMLFVKNNEYRAVFLSFVEFKAVLDWEDEAPWKSAYSQRQSLMWGLRTLACAPLVLVAAFFTWRRKKTADMTPAPDPPRAAEC